MRKAVGTVGNDFWRVGSWLEATSEACCILVNIYDDKKNSISGKCSKTGWRTMWDFNVGHQKR